MPRRKFNNKPRGQRGPSSVKRRRNLASQARRGLRFSVKCVSDSGAVYGGTLHSTSVDMPQPFSPAPKGPLPGADYSTAQFVNNMNVNPGVTSGSTTRTQYVQAQAAANTYFALAFEFQDLPQSTSFATIFDQYRIDKVEMRFAPTLTANTTQAPAAASAIQPDLFVVMDFDDASQPTSLAQIQEYDNMQVVGTTEGLFLSVEPSYTPAVYAAGAFSGYAVDKAGWCDIASNTIEHYGVKGCVTALAVSSAQVYEWEILTKYYVSFRKTR